MTNQMPDRIKIARMGIGFICPAWDKDEHATEYIRADLAQKTVTRDEALNIVMRGTNGTANPHAAREYIETLITAGIVKVSD